ILQAGSSVATTFTVDTADLVTGGSVFGNTGVDTLIVDSSAFNLVSTALSSVEILQAGLTVATTFTVDQADLDAGGSSSAVIGNLGNDTLQINGNNLDLTNTTLSSVEILKAGNSGGTVFTVDQADLASGGSVIGIAGSSSIDTLQIHGTSLD